MKNHLGTIVTLLAVVGIIFSGVALAQVTGQSESSGFSPPQRTGFGHSPPKHAGHFLARAIHENVVLEVLTEMTGKDAATVKADMQTLRMRALLESYGIDKESFRLEMDAKMTELVNLAEECGLITEVQEAEIIEAMQNRLQRQPGPTASVEEP